MSFDTYELTILVPGEIGLDEFCHIPRLEWDGCRGRTDAFQSKAGVEFGASVGYCLVANDSNPRLVYTLIPAATRFGHPRGRSSIRFCVSGRCRAPTRIPDAGQTPDGGRLPMVW